MFAKTIIDSDAFLDMPASARLLYYDLSMRADDDGFVNAPRKIIRMTGASIDDMNVLVLKKFIIPFESGIVVIKHWKIHNYIRKDMYKPTKYIEEKSTLYLDENNAYKQVCHEPVTNPLQLCNEPVTNPSTQDRLGKDRLGKDSIYNIPQKIENEASKKSYGLYNNILISDNELETLKNDYPNDWKDRIEEVSIWYHSKNRICHNGSEKVRSWKLSKQHYKQYEPDLMTDEEMEEIERLYNNG